MTGTVWVLVTVLAILGLGTWMYLMSVRSDNGKQAQEQTGGSDPSNRHRGAGLDKPEFFAAPPANGSAPSPDVALRQVEHHIRRESMVAKRFAEDPTPENLWPSEPSAPNPGESSTEKKKGEPKA